jgi:hypothetical protein
MRKRSKDEENGGNMTGNSDDAVGSEIPIVDSSGALDGFDVLFGGESEEWPERAQSKGYRAPWPVTVLMALLLLVGGLWLGAFLQRGHPSSTVTSASSLAGRFAAGLAATGSSASTGASSASSQVTSGTVTDIIGNTLYVTNSSGALVPVKMSSTTTIDRNAASSLSSLKPGDTVTVEGPTAKNGTVSATSVSATAKGVTSAGFGGGAFSGRFGGSTGTSATSGSSASPGG